MKIIIDLFQLKRPEKETLEVVDEASYKKARACLLEEKLGQGMSGVIVYASAEPYVYWFDDMPELVSEVTPRSLLAEKHPGVILPANLNNADIMDLDLLKKAVIPTDHEIFQYFFGFYIPQDISNIDTFYKLAKIIIDKPGLYENLYLNTLWKSVLDKLSEHSSGFFCKILAPLRNEDSKFADILAQGIYCSKNKRYLENWIHENKRLFHELGVESNELKSFFELYISNQEFDYSFEREITDFITSNFGSGQIDYSYLSGYYEGELNAVLELKPQLDLETYTLLLEKFATKISPIQQRKLSSLCLPEYKTPPSLEGLSISEQSHAWKDWAIQSFIPYKYYYDSQNERSEEILDKIETGSVAFSDWMFTNYASIVNDNSIFTNLEVIDHVRNFLDVPDTKVIWLIIDGFPAQYTPILHALLKECGINKVDTNWSIATAPTITDLGIPIMLSGRFESAMEKGEKRLKLMEKGFDNKNCIYTTKQSDFLKSMSSEYDLCCIHTHEIDDLMHKNDGEFDVSRDDEVTRILENRIKMVADIIKDNSERKIKLVISTDHGATKCLKNNYGIRNKILNGIVKENARERCVALNEALNTTSFDSNELYVLTKEISRNNDDWAIARGYHYFGNNDSGYRHGGLSPEEVVVPVIFCEITAVKEAKLYFRYVGDKDLRFGKTERDFSLKVKNNDTIALEILNIQISEDENCIFDLPVTVRGNSEIKLTSTIKLSQKLQRKSKEGKLTIGLSVKSRVMGEEIIQDFSCIVNTEKDDFENDFEF